MLPSPSRPAGRSLGLYLFFLVGTVSGCSLLVDAALNDKGAGGAGGVSGSNASSGVTSAGSTSAGSSSASTTGAGAGSTGSSSSAAASSSSSGEGSCSGSMMCNLPNAMAACTNGQCVITSCMMGFADCDMMPGDGCEVHLKSDPQHCGSCSNACQPTQTCTGGMCK